MLGRPSKSKSHTPARISPLGQDLPGPADRNSRTSNSRAVRGDLLSPRHSRGPRGRSAGRHVDRHRRSPWRAPKQRANPGDQHRERERLGQVVVGAGVEGLGLVEVAVLGREHEDRRPVAGLAQIGADLEAVATGQHDVEDDQVVGALGRPPGPSRRRGHLDREALGLQAAPTAAAIFSSSSTSSSFTLRPLGTISPRGAEPRLNAAVGSAGGQADHGDDRRDRSTGAAHDLPPDSSPSFGTPRRGDVGAGADTRPRPSRRAGHRPRRRRRLPPEDRPGELRRRSSTTRTSPCRRPRWVYEGESDGEPERIEVEVLDESAR